MGSIRKHKWLLSAGASLVLAGASVGWFAGRARANGIPAANPLHYSGTLAEKGVPVDGPRDITIVIWSDAQSTDATNQLCVTAAGSTPVAAGRFEIPLDNSCTAKVTAAPETWVEVQVGGVSFGRQKVGAVPYSITSALTAEVDGVVKSTVVAPAAAADGSLGRGVNDASIYNDPTKKSLVITGNNASGAHSVLINDSAVVATGLTVGAAANAGSLTVNGNASVTGKLALGIYVKSLASATQVNCNAGDVAIAGGADCSNGTDSFILQSYPFGSGWYSLCQNHNQSFTDSPANIYVVCLQHAN